MAFETLPVGNGVDVVVTTLHYDYSDVAITDAVLTHALYDVDGVLVAGTDGGLVHQGAGTYLGSFDPTTDLTADSKYRLVIACSNYPYHLEQWYRAKARSFEE